MVLNKCVLELGYRAQFAYPNNFVLSPDALPFTLAAIQARLRGLFAYGINIFVAGDNGNIPLWTKHSGLNPAGLDYLIEIGKQYYDRRQPARLLKTGDHLAVLGGTDSTGVGKQVRTHVSRRAEKPEHTHFGFATSG